MTSIPRTETKLRHDRYEEGLYRDRRCFTALNRLISRALVSQKDAIQLVESLFPKEKQQHLYHLYRCVVLAEDPSQQVSVSPPSKTASSLCLDDSLSLPSFSGAHNLPIWDREPNPLVQCPVPRFVLVFVEEGWN